MTSLKNIFFWIHNRVKAFKITQNNKRNVHEAKSRLKTYDEVSSTFCIAKWLQSTIHLHNGHTHSCYLPPMHKIDITEVQADPSSLHNTPLKLEERQAMLEGEKPAGCSTCWDQESLNENVFSDRHNRNSNTDWAYPNLQKVLNSPLSKTIKPTYLEVIFDNSCNFRCSYCSPDYSSSWLSEVQEFGPYKTSRPVNDLGWLKKSERFPIPETEANPYIDAFWEWWPSLSKELNTFRLTGGEPLLSKNCWKMISYFEKNPHPKMNFVINSNLSVDQKRIDLLISKTFSLQENLNSFEIFTSCDCAGKPAEYARYGLDYECFIQNISKILLNSHPQTRINIMITFNIFCFDTFIDLLKDIKNIREKFPPIEGKDRLQFSISNIHWPDYLSPLVAPIKTIDDFSKKLNEFISQNSISNSGKGFLYMEEVDQLHRQIQYLQAGKNIGKEQLVSDLYIFLREYDNRKNLRYEKTFSYL